MENLQPLISVIICTYNGLQYLEKSIYSVLNQTYSNFEIIIVDDGSTDDTVKLVEQLTKKFNNIYLYKKKNEGLAVARTYAFSRARGEWFAIIDQDDLCYKDRLQEQYKIAQQYQNAKLIFSDTNLIDEQDHVFDTYLRRFNLPKNCIPKILAANLLLRKGCFIDSESWFMHRSVFEYFKELDRNLKYACDYDFFIKVGFHFDFAYSTKTLSAWRIHKDQQTSTNKNRFNETKNVIMRYYNSVNVDLLTKIFILYKYSKLSVASVIYKFK